MLFLVDMAGAEKWRRHAIHANAVFFGQTAQAPEFLCSGIEAAFRDLGITADITNAVAGEVLEVLLIARRALASQFHGHGLAGCGSELFPNSRPYCDASPGRSA